MKTDGSAKPDSFASQVTSLLSDLEALYKDVHSHPELSLQETRTAGIAAERLRAVGYEVASGIGKTGVVGVLRNGPGPTVMLRAVEDFIHFYGLFVPGESTRRLVRFNSSVALDLNRREVHFNINNAQTRRDVPPFSSLEDRVPWV